MSLLLAGGFGQVLPFQEKPVAILSATPATAVLGAVVRLDGSGSLSGGDDTLSYVWDFVTVPIGSMVVAEGFRSIVESGASVWFSPDRVGEYVIRLTVSNSSYSDSTTVRISTRAILVPDGRGIVPDGKFIWSYIRDVWQQVDNKEAFETLWSALIQICGAEMLRLYQVDFNKSIRDIQEKMQRRWLCYEPRLEIDAGGMTAFVGSEEAGLGAATQLLGREARAIILSPSELVVVEGSVVNNPPSYVNILYSQNASNVGEHQVLGLNSSNSGYRLAEPVPAPNADLIAANLTPTFTFQSRIWALGAAPDKDYALKMSEFPATFDQLLPIFLTGGTGVPGIRAGDVAVIASGLNAGIYRITAVTGSFIQVDHAPPSSVQPGDLVSIYRPVGIRFPPLAGNLTDTFTIPRSTGSAIDSLAAGRLVLVGGNAYQLARVLLDLNQPVPTFILTSDSVNVVTNRTGLNWRVPNTLVSPTIDFETSGVSSGDVLLIDITQQDSSFVATFRAQVLGVHKNRLGFVLTTDHLVPAADYSVADDVVASILEQLRIEGVTRNSNGSVAFEGSAKVLRDFIYSDLFQQQFGNRELTVSDGIVTPLGRFFITPRAIIRNAKIPVDVSLRSVPVLQEWVVQPEIIERDGLVYQLRGGTEYPLKRRPAALVEGNDYLIDSVIAFDETVPFLPGSDVLQIDGAGFISRHVMPGDAVSIKASAGLDLPYVVTEVLAENKLRLSTDIPSYSQGVVTAQVVITRQRSENFLRLLPGGYTASNPAPDRFWAEVSYFDNSEAIENNFGVLVGLTKETLEKVTKRISYRQAVAGLMFAYTRGSSLEKVRLGAQILLGLPFAEHRGIIRSIDNDYRRDTNGNAILGRLLVEDIDARGSASGIQRIYTYPLDSQSTSFSGVETNPTTGKTYVAGDIVEIFAPLAKGVAVSDYITDPLHPLSDARSKLQQFHSFRLRANDNVFDIAEVQLVSDFLKRITPSYIAFVLSDVMEMADTVMVSDAISLLLVRGRLLGGLSNLVDDVGTGLGTALMFDQRDYAGNVLVFWDDGIYVVRKEGIGLTGPGGSLDVADSLLDGGVGVSVAKIGDVVRLLDGPHIGTYNVQSVNSIVQMTLAYDSSAVIAEFTSTTTRYAILRRASSRIFSGSVVSTAPVTNLGYKGQSVTSTAPYTVVGVAADAETMITVDYEGLLTDGIQPGDWFLDSMGNRNIITYVTADSFYVMGSVSPTGSVRIYRPALLNPLPDVFVVSWGGGEAFWPTRLRALADPGDFLQVVTDTGEPTGLEDLFVIDGRIGVVASPPADGSYNVRLKKTNIPPYLSGTEHSKILDGVDLGLVAPSTITIGAGNMSFAIPNIYGVLPGDFIRFSDLNQIDIGYGLGMFPVASVTRGSPNDTVYVTRPSEAGTTGFAVIRRR